MAYALPAAGAEVARSDLVECRVLVQAQHDLEYVAIEVPKPGGCEPLNPLSGWDATMRSVDDTSLREETDDAEERGHRIYREEHPDRSVFFLPSLTAGSWEIRYRMRAAFSGDYRALPATVEAMYVPVLTGNSDARRLQILAPQP